MTHCRHSVAYMILIALFILRAVPFAKGSEDQLRPHVVLIVVDTLRADHVGASRNCFPVTPVLDSFAKNSVVFTRAYSTSSWTIPAVGSLMTGLLPSKHGATGHRGFEKRPSRTLASKLKNSGYITYGVTANPLLSKNHHYGVGFTH
jgi:arylsulfatase A-like enzyme